MSIKLPEWMDQYYRVLSDYEVEEYELPENPSFCEMAGGDDFYHIAYVMAYEEWEDVLMAQNLGVLEYGTYKGVKGIYIEEHDQIVSVTEDDVDATVDEFMDNEYDPDIDEIEGYIKKINVFELDPNKLELNEAGKQVIEDFNNSDAWLTLTPTQKTKFYDYQEFIETLDDQIFDQGLYTCSSDDKAIIQLLDEALDMARPYYLSASDIDYIKIQEGSDWTVISTDSLIELGKKYSRYPEENYS